MQDKLFLNTFSLDSLKDQLDILLELIHERLLKDFPISEANPKQLLEILSLSKSVPVDKKEFLEIAKDKLQPFLAHMIDVNHINCAAHLHCPPLITGIATEVLIAAFNLSMDSWDQSGVATSIEEQVIHWVSSLLNYPQHADGVFTSGGTQSNLMGILLAREAYAHQNKLQPFTETGVHTYQKILTILCTPQAHFSVAQAARWLGIGSNNVVTTTLENVDQVFLALISENRQPFVFVATAGCTDFGTIDPLSQVRNICDKYRLWMHVDAAVGGALLLTDQKKLLKGLEKSDSVTIDFHKLFFQPISTSVFMIKNKIHFKLINFFSDYLNRETDEQEGTINLVGKSLQTTRRFDALKIWLTWQYLGTSTMKILIETLLDRTQEIALFITKHPDLELAKPALINTVVFRYISKIHQDQNLLNHRIRKTLFDSGIAVIGQTNFNNNIYLKLTLMNPMITTIHLWDLLKIIVKQAKILELTFNSSEKSV